MPISTSPRNAITYAYVGGNPVNGIDPFGLYCLTQQNLNLIHDSVAGTITGSLVGGIESAERIGNPLPGLLLGGAVGLIAGVGTSAAIQANGYDNRPGAAAVAAGAVSLMTGDPLGGVRGASVAGVRFNGQFSVSSNSWCYFSSDWE